ALTFLVEHLPPQMHLVIATREDPLLPLARLRARGELTELRAADLRFTPSEAAEFLNSVMGLTLSPGNIAALEDRTEGRFAGLAVRRHCHPYHPLFAEVLSAHLLAGQPDQVATPHRRASEWYERHGSAVDAIRHALAAADFARAADLVELGVLAMLRSRQEATLLDWLKVLPDEVLRCRPVLSVAYAHVLLSSGEREGVEE